jgi:predicted acetyltransferase
MARVQLRSLQLGDEAEARAAHAELEGDNFTFLLGWDALAPWASYVSQCERHRDGLDVPEGWVPSSFLVAEAEGCLVGRISIRHRLNEFLADNGGHIGYGVRPGFRRRGHATAILRQGLLVARALGIEDVLVTCDEGNLASIAVVEGVGGVLEDVRPGEDGIPKRRYWL